MVLWRHRVGVLAFFTFFTVPLGGRRREGIIGVSGVTCMFGARRPDPVEYGLENRTNLDTWFTGGR